ncbi:MAG: hypothetical protein ABWY06_22190 [Pseudomonas sp.]|uniref:hypothetical protein n=1 Tax=Pseudomonas sp. TaxID=306 RepID=UPI00339B32AB
MRYHDFHLTRYEVSDSGKTIVLHLLYDYPDIEKEASVITFSEVTLYNFTHTASAILTAIDEVPLSPFIEEMGTQLTQWHHWHGLALWNGSPQGYALELERLGYKAWRIDSAIGFSGMVIAKAIR